MVKRCLHSVVMLQEKEKENASSFKVQYKRRHLNMYILFLLPSILIVIIIIIIIISSSSSSSSSSGSSSILVLNIVEMIVEWVHFLLKKAIVLLIFAIYLSHWNLPLSIEKRFYVLLFWPRLFCKCSLCDDHYAIL